MGEITRPKWMKLTYEESPILFYFRLPSSAAVALDSLVYFCLGETSLKFEIFDSLAAAIVIVWLLTYKQH